MGFLILFYLLVLGMGVEGDWDLLGFIWCSFLWCVCKYHFGFLKYCISCRLVCCGEFWGVYCQFHCGCISVFLRTVVLSYIAVWGRGVVWGCVFLFDVLGRFCVFKWV